MRAACVSAGGKPMMEIRDVPDPTPGPGEVVIAVKGCGICGSDLHATEMAGAIPAGTVMGHEFAGEIVAVGRGAQSSDGRSWKEGDRVCTMPAISCGVCVHCATGDVMGCEKVRATGFGEISGGFAEYALGAGTTTFRLPDIVASVDGAMVEPLAVGLHAVRTAAAAPGEDILIFGAGPVGLAIALWAKHFGAREIVVSDPVDHRRALAERLGATATVDPSRDELLPAFERIARHPPRMLYECVGRPGVLQECAGIADRFAKIVSAGVCLQPDTWMPVIPAVKQHTIQFVAYYRREDFALTVDMLGAERIDASSMVTDRISLDVLPQTFERLRTPTTECKVLVTP